MKYIILLQFLVLVLGLFPGHGRSEEYQVQEISYLSINSAISPGTLDYLQQNFTRIPKKHLIVIKINTPGGLVTTTKDIITLIGRQENPVAVWITPEGASASSAGAIIASAAHFIFMAPGTNIGAATPVGLGDDIKESDGRKKALNDLSAMVRSLSDSRGRPAGPFEQMITEAKSFTDKEALKLKIIDGIVSRGEEIMPLIRGKTFSLQGKVQTLDFTTEVKSQELMPTVGQQILEVLANPSTAYLLFLVGIALIYFEFQSPGGYIAGAVGVAFLIMAAIAFQVLPLNWGAMGLIILGFFFFILEIFVTSFGVLSLAGLACFIMGSLFLFHGESGFISINYPVIYSTLAGVFAGVGCIVWYMINDAKKQLSTADFFLPIDARGVILKTYPDLKQYQVKVQGEIWKAISEENLNPGDQIEVISVDQQRLIVNVKKTPHT